jgi:hypothetical protein
MESIFNGQDCFASLPAGYMDNAMFVSEIVNISFQKPHHFQNYENSPVKGGCVKGQQNKMTSYLVTVRSKSRALLRANFNPIGMFHEFKLMNLMKPKESVGL